MKEGDIIIAHGANWSGVFKVNKLREIGWDLGRATDHWGYCEFNISEDGRFELPPFYVQRLEAESQDAALRECEEIWNQRNPVPEMTTVASKDAEQAREAVLAKTEFGEVLAAIKANDPARAAKLFDDIAAAHNNPREDETATVARLRKLFRQRKSGRHGWQLLLVAHWDELIGKTYDEISTWLDRHDERGVTTAAVAKFMQLLPVKRKKTRK